MSSDSIHELPPPPAGERLEAAASEPVQFSNGDHDLSDSIYESPSSPVGGRLGVQASESALLSGGDQDRSEGEAAPTAQDGGASDAYTALQKTCESMLITLERLRASQETMERMELDKVNPKHKVRNLAQQIWTKLQEAPAKEEGCGLPPDSEVGKKFFEGLYPTKDNIECALRMLQLWMETTRSQLYEPASFYFSDIAARDKILDDDIQLWPKEWRRYVFGVDVFHSYPGPSVNDPFQYDRIEGDMVHQIAECKPVVLPRSSESLCSGLKTDTITYSCIKTKTARNCQAGSAA